MSKFQKTLVNGQAYSYVDMSFHIDGITDLDGFVGIPIKSIDYNGNQQKSFIYENSKFATGVSYGKMEFSGSVSFTLDSFEFLRDRIFSYSGNISRSILDLPPVDITINYVNRGKFNSHVIHNVVFTTENLSGAEGDDNFGVTCDFMASFINYGDNIQGGVATFVNIINSDDNQGNPVNQ